MRNQKGFTLIELMIVVAIIAILAAIAISQYQDYVIRAEISEGAALADGAKTAVVAYYNNHGSFPTTPCFGSNGVVGLSKPSSIVGNYVSSVTIAGTGCPSSLGAGSILTRFSSAAPFKAHDQIDTAALVFSPVTHAGSVEWRCKRFLIGSSVELRDKWLPTSCR
jgi:type IV pilus assembly protein PilA